MGSHYIALCYLHVHLQVNECGRAGMLGMEPVPKGDSEPAGGIGEIGLPGRCGSGLRLKPICSKKVLLKTEEQGRV